jgi:rhamnosyltransferase
MGIGWFVRIFAGKMLHPSNIFAVLVTFKVDYIACSSWQSLHQSQVASQMPWLVYDNSPNPSPTTPPAYLSYQHHPENLGVSAAYLAAAALAKERGCSWLLLLDQDSIFPTHWLNAYAAALSQNPTAKILTPHLYAGKLLISPSSMQLGRGWPAKKLPPSTYDLRKYAPLNAGILVQVDAYLQSGGHLKTVELDFSDFAFIHRFQKKYPKAELVDLHIEHALSGIEKPTYQAAYERFKYYCAGAAAFSQNGGSAFWMRFWCLWRAALLSLRYRNVKFFDVFWASFKKSDQKNL